MCRPVAREQGQQTRFRGDLGNPLVTGRRFRGYGNGVFHEEPTTV
jgi:hypothetical protein